MVFATHSSPNQKLKRVSPRKDSPSRQLDHELNYALEQLVLHDFECKKLHAYQRRTHHEELEARDTALAKSHMAALEAASAKHEAVRHEAEAVLRRHVREQEEIRLRKEAEERARQEQEAREQAERERKAREAAERKAREERDRREAEEQKAKQEDERRAQAEREEAQRTERELAAKRSEAAKAEAAKIEAERLQGAREAATKAEAEAKAVKDATDRRAAAAITTSAPVPTQSIQRKDYYAASTQAARRHDEYLALHKSLKQFRQTFWEEAKRNKEFKSQVGDMRRAMRTSVGQLTDDKAGNKQAQERVKLNIVKALSMVQSPPMPVNNVLPAHLHHPDNPSIPSLVVYLLSIFSKAIVAAFAAEVAVNPRAAEPIGTLTAQVFSMNELQLPNSQGSLIPILMAKLHACAPILFGVSGSEETPAGRVHLGWRTEITANNSKKSFVLEQRHHERMTGIGAGYSSIALRNFSRTKLRNPFPPTHFWASLSFIINTPPQLVTTSHLLLLKSMLDNNAPDRFVLFFGSTGIAALREALIEFPKRLSEKMQSTAAARSIGLMVEAFERERHFRLV